MRKLRLIAVLAALASLVVAAVAYAQAQERTNTYTVTGSTSPSKAGKKKRPVPVAVSFGYTVGEQSGLRPSPVQKYSIRMAGIRQNSRRFPKCTFSRINEAESTSVCPRGSRVGTGSIRAVAGSETNRSDQSINCPLNLEVYNSGRNRAAIYVVGGRNAPAGKQTSCPVDTNAALDARYLRRDGGTVLEFSVPLVPFRQQLGSIEVTVVEVQSTISRRTRRVRGKRVGYFEAIGGCRNRRRAITVTFLNEDGKTGNAQRLAPCRR